MRIDCKKLKGYLLLLLEENISLNNMSELVQLSRSIIQSYLGYIRNSVTQLCLHQGLTITDLAYDCIAEVFARDDKNKFPKLENFSNSLTDKLENLPEHEIFLAYKSLLTRIADCQLARLFAQADPAGAKIHRNIRDAVKRSDLLLIEKDYRGLILKLKDDGSEQLDEFPREELEREIMSRKDHQLTIPDLLDVCSEVLIRQNKYRTSVPLVDLVQIFRKIYLGDHTIEECKDMFASEGLTQFEIEQLCLEVLLSLKEKIFLTYLARGKVDRKVAEAIYNAFRDMLEDWCHGEESKSSMFQYLKGYLQIDDKQYEETYRTKMEYLLKIAREEFAARLMREL